MAKQNLKNIKDLNLPYPIIRVMDRCYTSLPDMYYSMEKNEKYLIPIKKDRHYPRNHSKKNKYSINKRRSF